MTGKGKTLGQAHAARLERLIKAKRAAAAPKSKAPALTLPSLTPEQKTASEPRLYRACVAQSQHF